MLDKAVQMFQGYVFICIVQLAPWKYTTWQVLCTLNQLML